MSNPAISKFNRYAAQQPVPVYATQQGQYAGYPGQPMPQQGYQQGYAQQGYAQQGQWGQQQPWPSNPPMYASPVQDSVGRLTMNDVLTKTGIMMGFVILIAALTYALLPLESALTWIAVAGASLAGFVVSLIVLTRKVVPAAGALTYAAIEGFFIGALSKAFEMYYPGIIAQAVLGTFVAAGLTVGAVKVFKIKYSKKFSMILMLAIASYAAAMLINFLLSLFIPGGIGMVDGIGSMTALGAIMTGVGVVLAVLSLVDDITSIQHAADSGAPATESWRGAMGLTITLVWLYINILRILSYIRR